MVHLVSNNRFTLNVAYLAWETAVNRLSYWIIDFVAWDIWCLACLNTLKGSRCLAFKQSPIGFVAF